ncbi:MAG: orotidine-5'-phosphate decarboxylase [Fimbriimonadaceae bacterium]|nr:orotidine-5'-phosphate decarboxylase [Fimbriimonadaceae bacterium]
MNHHVICALDTRDLATAQATVKKLSPYVGAFKIGHALTLPHGLDVVDRLREAGANRIFLDLKFHDIPNVIGLAIREVARRGVWMTTLHSAGGPAMLQAAAYEARAYEEGSAPLLIGVSVLTSLDEATLRDDLGVARSLPDQVVALSEMAIRNELDGVVASVHETGVLRMALGKDPIIVTPGIRAPGAETDDQKRVADAQTAMDAGASYLVIGRALTAAADPIVALRELGLAPDA